MPRRAIVVGSMLRRTIRQTAWALTAAVALLAPAPVSADGRPLIDGRAIQNGTGIELGVLTESGHTEYGSNDNDLSPSVQGLLIRDRNGVTARMAIGLIIAVGSALAQSGPKSVESKTYRQGDYIVTETTTTYYSEAEKAEMRAQTDRSIDGLFSARYSDFELARQRDRLGLHRLEVIAAQPVEPDPVWRAPGRPARPGERPHQLAAPRTPRPERRPPRAPRVEEPQVDQRHQGRRRQLLPAAGRATAVVAGHRQRLAAARAPDDRRCAPVRHRGPGRPARRPTAPPWPDPCTRRARAAASRARSASGS
jgi:hypothetical protein